MIGGRLGMWAAGAFVALALLAGIWWLIDSRARLSAEVDRQDAHIEAWERVNDADLSAGDPDDDLRWLLERAGIR